MARSLLITSALLASCLLGGQGAHLGGRLESNITGIVTQPSSPGAYLFRPLEVPLHANDKVISSEIVVVELSRHKQREEHKVLVLVGPKAGGQGTTVVAQRRSNQDIQIDGEGAWVYARSRPDPEPSPDHDDPADPALPWWSGRWVSAQATGSAVAVHIVNEDLDRVFFFEGQKVVVRCLVGDKRSVWWTKKDSYVDVTLDDAGNCKFEPSDPSDLSTLPPTASTSMDPTVKFFLLHLNLAKAAAPSP